MVYIQDKMIQTPLSPICQYKRCSPGTCSPDTLHVILPVHGLIYATYTVRKIHWCHDHLEHSDHAPRSCDHCCVRYPTLAPSSALAVTHCPSLMTCFDSPCTTWFESTCVTWFDSPFLTVNELIRLTILDLIWPSLKNQFNLHLTHLFSIRVT